MKIIRLVNILSHFFPAHRCIYKILNLIKQTNLLYIRLSSRLLIRNNNNTMYENHISNVTFPHFSPDKVNVILLNRNSVSEIYIINAGTYSKYYVCVVK